MDAPRPAEELPAVAPTNANVRVKDNAKLRPGMVLDPCDPLDAENDCWIYWVTLPRKPRFT